MKVVVTALKAPWPAGAVVGSLVELPGPVLPAWAVGKCKPAEDDAEAQFVWEAPPPIEPLHAPDFVVNPASEADEKARVAAALLEAAEQEADELRALLEAEKRERNGAEASFARSVEVISNLQAELAATQAERDAARAEIDALKAALAEAQAKADAAPKKGAKA